MVAKSSDLLLSLLLMTVTGRTVRRLMHSIVKEKVELKSMGKSCGTT